MWASKIHYEIPAKNSGNFRQSSGMATVEI